MKRGAFRALPTVVALVLVASASVGSGPARVTRADSGASLTCGPMSILPSPNGSTGSVLAGVAGTSPRDIIAVGASLSYTTTTVSQQLTEHFDGSTWSVLPNPTSPLTGGVLVGLVALSPTSFWAVGYTGVQVETALIESWNGSVWRVVANPTTGFSSSFLEGGAAVTARNIWAVGAAVLPASTLQPLIEHWNGAAWSVTPSQSVGTDSRLFSVSAVPGTDQAWAVGETEGVSTTTLIEHWNGAQWSIVPSPDPGTDNYLNAVSFTSPTDGWAVGSANYPGSQQALIEHWDGTAWTVVLSPNVGQLAGLNGIKAYAGGALAVGFTVASTGGPPVQTLVERWNGTAWTVVSSPNVAATANTLYGVSLIPNSRQVVTVGDAIPASSSASQTLIESNCQ